ncbi:MAG: 2Fe-2S iron-sulfur cluster-binding protein [Gammaproteobacteria bacterium]
MKPGMSMKSGLKPGLFVDPAQRFYFDFDGRRIAAFAGDTVATALWRNGVKTLSRSFKYHRRRGVLSLSGADANTLMDIGGAPNAQADRVPAVAGLIARARHCWGNAENDYYAALNGFSRFLPPGFYYKAFYRPRGAWPLWEPLIRRMAGIGQVNPAAEERHVETIYDFCDVAVIGGGPAGIAAARAAMRAGKTVRLLDKNPKLGGALNWRGGGELDGDFIAAAEKEIPARLSCEAAGVFADNLIAAHAADYSLRLRAEKIIYATGARDSPVVFANNDLPGVMLVSAALRLAFLYDLACGRQTAVLAGGRADADAARALQRYGANIAAVFNLGEPNAAWAEELSADGFAVYHGVSEFSAHGRLAVEGVRAVCGGRQTDISCDCVLMNGGAIPAAELPAAAGVAFPYCENLRRPAAEHSSLAGGVHNRTNLTTAAQDGEAAATNAVRPPADDAPSPDNIFLHNGRGKAFADFDEDLQIKDLDDAIDEGFDDIQLLKRYTTAGMGPSQGKLTNILILRHLAKRRPVPPENIGQVTARPPAAAETLAQLARPPLPLKQTALHRAHLHLSATLMNAGAWRRPAHYANAEKEAAAVRQNAGIVDISTLGKIQISGDDAAVLLERLYTGKFAAQKTGAMRYALMLDEAGIIMDDGVVARLDGGRFWLTTTTGNADAIYRQMLLWRARWRLRADILNMTSAFAAVNLAGPNAAPLLEKLAGGEIDLGYMRAAEINIGGAEAILLRTGFVGEKGFEIHLPAGFAPDLWNTLLADAAPFGVDAQRLLRLEKGHIIVGQDTDGLTTPLEAGMEWALGKNKPFYLGQRALEIYRRRGIRRVLRGFTVSARRQRPQESDLVLARNGDAVGRVTSVAYSPTLQRVIGLAYAPAGTPAHNGKLLLRAAGGEIMETRTFAPPFYDPQGERQK